VQGHHLTADLAGCPPGLVEMTDARALRALCLACVRAAGLSAVGELFHVFPPPGGVTGMVLLAESHVAVHTWPERGTVTLDVYVCNVSQNNAAAADRLLARLIQAFAPGEVRRQHWLRGVDVVESSGASPGA
jgi:S-adenosylmethionine decarboxylase